jgi:hypothetical protein
LELKSYQQRVIDDLTSFLNYLERGVGVGESSGKGLSLLHGL